MKITITTGTGEGPTPLGAFDAALLAAGVANYNLIPLSSVIPAGSVVQRAHFITPEEEYGYRLYVVMARQQVNEIGLQAWAGLGWTQEAQTGRGLFVELEGCDRQQVESDIHATLGSMVANRPLSYGSIQTELSGIECRGLPACALAIAVYESQGWE